MQMPLGGQGEEVNQERSALIRKLQSFTPLPQDDINRYPFQQPARGLAVSGFVFSLMHVFSFGVIPPLACLGIVCSVIAYLKGNRQTIVYLGFALGLIGLAASVWMTVKLGGVLADPVVLARTMRAAVPLCLYPGGVPPVAAAAAQLLLTVL